MQSSYSNIKNVPSSIAEPVIPLTWHTSLLELQSRKTEAVVELKISRPYNDKNVTRAYIVLKPLQLDGPFNRPENRALVKADIVARPTSTGPLDRKYGCKHAE